MSGKSKNQPFLETREYQKMVRQLLVFRSGPSVTKSKEVIRHVASKKLLFEEPHIT